MHSSGARLAAHFCAKLDCLSETFRPHMKLLCECSEVTKLPSCIPEVEHANGLSLSTIGYPSRLATYRVSRTRYTKWGVNGAILQVSQIAGLVVHREHGV